jgi:uncharacterized protein YqgV (UPF0045/DUF77 family)
MTASGELTAELSLYPLHGDYRAIITRFIEDLNERPGLTIVTNAMSTQLCGEHDVVMAAVSATLRASAERFGAQVLVCKFIPMSLAITGKP